MEGAAGACDRWGPVTMVGPDSPISYMPKLTHLTWRGRRVVQAGRATQSSALCLLLQLVSPQPLSVTLPQARPPPYSVESLTW